METRRAWPALRWSRGTLGASSNPFRCPSSFAPRAVRLVAGNVLVRLILVLVANAQVAGIYVVLDEWSDRKEKGDERVELPNSLDKDHARKIFAETRRLETRYAPFVEWKRKAFHGETVNVDEAGDRVHHAPGRGIDHKLVYPRQQQAISALQAKGNGDWIHDVTDAHDGDEFI